MLSLQVSRLSLSRLSPLFASTRLLSASTPAKGKIPEGFAKIKERQKLFTKDNKIGNVKHVGMFFAINTSKFTNVKDGGKAFA